MNMYQPNIIFDNHISDSELLPYSCFNACDVLTFYDKMA